MSDDIERAAREWCQSWTCNAIHEPSERVDSLAALIRAQVEKDRAVGGYWHGRFQSEEDRAEQADANCRNANARIAALEAALEKADALAKSAHEWLEAQMDLEMSRPNFTSEQLERLRGAVYPVDQDVHAYDDARARTKEQKP